MTTETEMCEIIRKALHEYDENIEMETFDEAGIQTNYAGIMLKLDDCGGHDRSGSEFHVLVSKET